MKYNPAFLDDAALIQSFTSRRVELELILEIIRENAGDSNQHVLLIGPRGIGKTTLALRVAAEIRAVDPLREQWYPLAFGEESYGVTTPGEFWLEALFHLGKQTQKERWKRAHDELRTERDEDRLRQRALVQLMDFADEHDKRLLLVVENLNMLVGSQMSGDDAWTLRHTLMNEPRLMLLGTATSRFKEVEEYDQALYDLFRVIELDPLDDGEARALWASVTGTEPSPVQIRPIQILTGGNPRLIRILSEFAADVSFGELMENLLHLVDEHTEYFKYHLDRLPPQERKVFVALADLWDPSTARAVADQTRLDVNTTSALLRRLRDRGAVTSPYERGRAKYYQLAERLYNIYHLMRRRGPAASRVRAAVHFMTHLYRGERLVQATQSLLEEAEGLAPAKRRDHLMAYQHILDSIDESALKQRLIEDTRHYLTDMPDAPPSILRLIEKVESEKGENLKADEVEAGLMDLRVEEVDDIETLLRLAHVLEEQPDRWEEAEAAYRKVLRHEPNNPVTWIQLGLLLILRNRYEEALDASNRVINSNETSTFAPQVTALAWQIKSMALRHFGQQEEALDASSQAIKLDKTDADAWGSKGDALRDLERYQEALVAYNQALSLNENDVLIWKAKALTLKIVNRYEEALAAYDQALTLDETDIDTWSSKGDIFRRLERYEEALAAYNQALAFDETRATTWSSKGDALRDLERYKEALAAYNQALALDKTNASFWSDKGRTLHRLGRYEEALDAYDQALSLNAFDAREWQDERIHSDISDRYKKLFTARTILLREVKGLTLSILGRYDEAIDIFEKCIEESNHAPENLDSLARLIYEGGEKSGWAVYFPEAEAWARRAVEQEPENGHYQLTLAALLGAQDTWPEALSHARAFLRDPGMVEAETDLVIDFFIDAAAAGHSEEIQKLIQSSPSAELLEPLTVGLRLRQGEEVDVAREIWEVARDVVERIEAREEEMRQRASEEKK